MNKIIIDGMKKEGKSFISIVILGCAFVVLTFGYMYVNNKSLQDKDVLIMFLGGLSTGIIGLYGWFYAFKYSLTITEQKIVLKTLFKKHEMNICDITKYTCNRYKSSVFYQFHLFIKDKRILVNTRYKEEFEKILKDNKIPPIIK